MSLALPRTSSPSHSGQRCVPGSVICFLPLFRTAAVFKFDGLRIRVWMRVSNWVRVTVRVSVTVRVLGLG